MNDQRVSLLNAERRTVSPSPAGRLRIGIGYPNSYHVGMSSLAYQWVTQLAASCPDVGVERFFAGPPWNGRTLDNDTPLGDLDILAWSCSFELDAVNILATLRSAGIPTRRRERCAKHPLLVMGGAVASINPLPLSEAIDVFILGSAERLWSPFLEHALQVGDRDHLLDTLAASDGYFVPSHHLDATGRPIGRRRRLEKRDAEMADPDLVPVSHVVTPNTEYADRGLVEMSRGCPEKCRYCWVSYNYGRLRSYPEEHILGRIERLRHITDRVGFVATAVGDHPRLVEILDRCRSLGLNVALSSLRIPAMRREVLEPLALSGARSVTIAPETGTDELRRRLNKPITNATIVEAAEVAQACGIPSLKAYFIIGLPGESDEDVLGIAGLIREIHSVLLTHGRQRGHVGTLHAGFNVLVPKPYTPYSREAMLTRQEARRRMALVERALSGLSNLRITRPAYRESLWQCYLGRSDAGAITILERAAEGVALGPLIAEHRTEIEASALARVEGDSAWRFITSAPVATSSVADASTPTEGLSTLQATSSSRQQ